MKSPDAKVENKMCTQISLQQAQCLPTAFLLSLSFMKFCVPHVINSYSTNKFAEWIQANTKITQSINIQKYVEFKIIIQAQFKLQISPINFTN